MSRADELSDYLPPLALRLSARLEERFVIETAAEGLVKDYQAALVRIWIVGPAGRSRYRSMRIGDDLQLRLKAEALRRVNMDAETGREVMAAPWIDAIARSRTAIASNRLFHGGNTPDAQWMRQNRFRSFAGYPLAAEQDLVGVLAVFSRHSFSDRSFKLLRVFAGQLGIALQRSMEAKAGLSPGASIQIPTGTTLDDAMRSYIENTLKSTAGKIEGSEGAAELLGLHPNTLRSRMSKLGVRRP